MVKHIVLFQLKDELTVQEKNEIYLQFKQGIEALPSQIPSIKQIFVGRNVNPDEAWDICLKGDFATLEEVVAYGKNPIHLKVSAALKPHLKGRSCVDYEF